jgi:cell division protein FtsW (lipid II flippase)
MPIRRPGVVTGVTVLLLLASLVVIVRGLITLWRLRISVARSDDEDWRLDVSGSAILVAFLVTGIVGLCRRRSWARTYGIYLLVFFAAGCLVHGRNSGRYDNAPTAVVLWYVAGVALAISALCLALSRRARQFLKLR